MEVIPSSENFQLTIKNNGDLLGNVYVKAIITAILMKVVYIQ